jgi:RNA polymerase sigma factor for flagellar operon FliA
MTKEQSVNSVNIESLRQQESVRSAPIPALNDEFMKDHMPMVEALAANILSSGKVPPGMEFNDLVSWGAEGLIKAHQNYKLDKGSQFKTYAYYRIRGEIFDQIRVEWRYRNPNEYQDYRKRNQEKIADLAQTALDDFDSTQGSQDGYVNRLITNSAVMCLMSLDSMDVESVSDGTRNPETQFIDEKQDILWEEIRKLDAEEQRIIELFYIHEMKQKDIAETLGISRSSVCRVHMKILEKLKIRLKHKDVH